MSEWISTRAPAIALGLALGLGPNVVFADEPNNASHPVELVTFGVLCGFEVESRKYDQDTVDGEVLESFGGHLGYDVITTTVPARQGLAFGITYRALETAGNGRLTASVTHPPMGEQGVVRQTWDMLGFQGFMGAMNYALEDDFELVPGDWTFRLHAGDQMLIEMSFEMVGQSQAPEVMKTCFPVEADS